VNVSWAPAGERLRVPGAPDAIALTRTRHRHPYL